MIHLRMDRRCLRSIVLTVITLIPASLAQGQEQEQQKQESEQGDRGWSNVADVGIVALAGNTSSITLQADNKLRHRTAGQEWTLWAGALKIQPSQRPFAIGSVDDFVVVDPPRFVAAERYYISSRYNRQIDKRFFGVGGGAWGRDQNAGIENLFSLYGGVGNLWLDHPEHNLRTDYSIAYTDRAEDIPDPEKDERFPEARFSLEYVKGFGRHAKYDSAFVFHAHIGDATDYRFTANNSVTASLTNIFSLRGSLQFLYRNLPALEEVALYGIPPEQGGVASDTVLIRSKKLDATVKLSLVITFWASN